MSFLFDGLTKLFLDVFISPLHGSQGIFLLQNKSWERWEAMNEDCV